MAEQSEQGQPGQTTEKSDAQVMFPDVEILGYKIKPWKLGQLVDLAPVIAPIKAILEEEKITMTNITDRWMDLLPKVMPYVPKILVISVEGMTEETARELEVDKAGFLVVNVVAQNWDYLKNSLGLGLGRYKVTTP